MFSLSRDRWRKLDNAAKIFPATSSHRDTRVFRFYCECCDPIEPDALQDALDITIKKYPMFLSVLRKGVFWFYMEQSNLRPVVEEEDTQPCLLLYHHDKKTLLFKVTYYKNRINLEVFHALTDGTGASQFLRELVRNYLVCRYPQAKLPDVSFTEPDMTVQDQETDGFTKYYKKEFKKTEKKPKAFQLTGPKTAHGELNITEGRVSCKALLAKAKEYQVSITVFLSAVLLCAIREEMSKRQINRPVTLMVPANLRTYFPSVSMLNFFAWIEPYYQFSQEEYSFDDVLRSVARYYKEELNKDGLGRRFSHYMKMECNPILRFCPLGIKNLGMQIGALFSNKDVTAVFSNLGIVSLPPEYEPYIRYFGVFTSTKKIELSMCSFQDELVLSFASGYQHQNIERNFFRLLKGFGIETNFLTDCFPEKKSTYEGIKFFQYFSFACVAAVVICGMVNYLVTPKLNWSVFVAGGSLSMWITLAVGFFKRHNLLKNGIWQMLIIPTVCIIWDYYTGWNEWSLDFVMPCVYFVILVSMVIITRIQKLSVESYMIYYIMSGILGLIPAFLLMFRISNFPIFAVLCSGISFLWLIALVIFKRRDFFVELYKKLHF